MDYIIINISLFFTVLIFLWIRWRKRKFAIFSNYGIPGPKPSFWTGNINDIMEKRNKFTTEGHEKYGGIFGYFYGAHPILSITDPDLIKLVQVKEFNKFANKKFPITNGGIPSDIILKSLVYKEDEEWKKTRSILSPSFSSGKLRNMSQIINNCIDEFLENISQKSIKNDEFDIFSLYKKLTLDLISRTAFGIHTDAQKGKDTLLVKSIGRVLGTDVSSILPYLSVCFPEMEPIPSKLYQLTDVVRNLLGYSAVKTVLDTTQDIITHRINSGQKRKDLLQSMIDGKVGWKKLLSTKYEDLVATGELAKEDQKSTDNESNDIKLTADELKGNALLFLAAGYDTSSATLGFTTQMLSIHQDVQDAVRNEMKEAIGEKKQIEYDDIVKLQYMDQVISEILRLYPVTAVTVTRTLKEEFKVNDGLTIPTGIILSVPVSTLHRDPKHWTEPDKFMPERFSPENKSNINTTIYQPFGNGPRNCIGMRLAQTIIKLTLARLLLSYRLECTSQEVSCLYNIFLLHPERVMIKTIPLTS